MPDYNVWEMDRIQTCLRNIKDQAFGRRLAQPIFHIPRKDTDADAVLYDAVRELAALRQERTDLLDALGNARTEIAALRAEKEDRSLDEERVREWEFKYMRDKTEV